MNILIDYDNVPRAIRMKGLVYLTEKVLYCLGRNTLATHERVHVRLYGGWYEYKSLSPSAQALAPTILAEFPRLIPVQDNQAIHRLRVTCELAYSLQIEPAFHFWHTYRRRGMPGGIYCESPVKHGCKRNPCALQIVYDFFNKAKCPESGCAIRPEDIVRRDEQKLVDTMLLADLIYSALVLKIPEVCLVSSDDDLWPGIRFALYGGTSIYHIHPRAGQSNPPYYHGTPGIKYQHLNL
jgi:hypothetical protein